MTRKYTFIGFFLVFSALFVIISVQHYFLTAPKLVLQGQIPETSSSEKNIPKKKRLIYNSQLIKTQCKDQGHTSSIFLFIIKSRDMEFSVNEEVLQRYAKLHGYQLKFLLAESFINSKDKTTFHQILLDKYKRSQSDLIKTMKSVVIQGK